MSLVQRKTKGMTYFTHTDKDDTRKINEVGVNYQGEVHSVNGSWLDNNSSMTMRDFLRIADISREMGEALRKYSMHLDTGVPMADAAKGAAR